ncbi:choline ABC transporter substrate-binding protein [Candidatus Liberibacter sp.]|uniref:choline ABC transporter substrate-binding protein n=1 Tax=Candidatus Liberibacter sp. TaxID=34022 RepID=UPI0015F4AE8E|nr:choline ABC transporter substrate-binding protein [Candidatus Liberibacter sp.]MBA5723588.1 choline ABC transporter substrate-binding protein [Candidatus Liberibacter sp.]
MMRTITVFLLCVFTVPLMVQAKDPKSCSLVRFADSGWTDIAATTAMTSVVLEILGYKTDIKLLSLPVAIRSLKNKNEDVFMGYWYPSMEPNLGPYLKEGSIQKAGKNLEGARYTLAVNDAGFELGIRDYKDIVKYKKELGSRIYGIEPGNDGNQRILDMITSNKFSLKGFRLVESSEQAMFSQIKRNQKNNHPAVFLGWEPHPINLELNVHYLFGGDEVFGSNLGEASVYTVVRSGYLDACPNVSRLLQNIKFSVAMENEMMKRILSDKEDPKFIGKQLLRSNPDLLKAWLVGVTSFEGQDPMQEVEKFLGN